MGFKIAKLTCYICAIAGTVFLFGQVSAQNPQTQNSAAPLFTETSKPKPVVLIYHFSPGAGASESLAKDASQDAKTFFRETNRVDAVLYDPSSLIVERAILEKSLTREQASYPNSPELREKIAKMFDTEFYALADITKTENNVDVTLTVVETASGRKWSSPQRATVAGSGDPSRDLANARMSAVRSAVMQIAQDAFSGIDPSASYEQNTAASILLSEPTIDLDAKVFSDRMAKAERFADEGNTAGAISEYKRAININPKAVEPRLKLAEQYIKLKQYDQAADELKRARKIAPDSIEVSRKLAEVYELQGAIGSAIEEIKSLPSDGESAVSADDHLAMGDLYWKNAKIEEAINEYKAAIKSDPQNYVPHVRLARVLAAKAKFTDASKELEIAAKLAPKGVLIIEPETFYSFLKIIDAEIRAIYAQYVSGDAAFQSGDRTREEFYNSLKDLQERAFGLAQFTEKLPTPEEYRVSCGHRALGLTLLGQGIASMMAHVQADAAGAKTEASLYITEAVKEFQSAFELDKRSLQKSPSK